MCMHHGADHCGARLGVRNSFRNCDAGALRQIKLASEIGDAAKKRWAFFFICIVLHLARALRWGVGSGDAFPETG